MISEKTEVALTDLSRQEPREFPSVVNLELTSRCNLSCIMCYRNQLTADDGDMSIDLAMALTEQCAAHGAIIKLYWRGEPLLYPEIKTYLAMAQKTNAALVLVTNGTRMDEELAELIVSHNMWRVCFSIDSNDPITFARVRRNGNLHDVLRNADLVREARGDHPMPAIGVNFVEMDINRHQVSTAKMEWGESFDFFDHAVYNNAHDRGPVLRTEVESFTKPECDKCIYPCKVGNEALCAQLQTKLFVGWDGRVFPCCMSFNEPADLQLGSAAGDSLWSIWNGTRRAEILDAFTSEGLPDTCARCGMQYNC